MNTFNEISDGVGPRGMEKRTCVVSGQIRLPIEGEQAHTSMGVYRGSYRDHCYPKGTIVIDKENPQVPAPTKKRSKEGH